MNPLGETFALAASGMQAQATRLRLSAENIANADTPGYRRKLAEFAPATEGAGVRVGRVLLDQRPAERIHDPSHPLAGPDGSYAGSNVDLVIEIADSRAAGRSYEASLRLFDQAQQMGRSLVDLLRR